MPMQAVLDKLKEREILDLLIAHVNTHAEVRNLLPPLLADAQCLLKDPSPDGHNGLSLLKDADEFHGRDHVPLFVLPAEQRLRTDNMLVVACDLRLEVKLEIAAASLDILKNLLLNRQRPQPAVIDLL